jgi:uncharacterized protein
MTRYLSLAAILGCLFALVTVCGQAIGASEQLFPKPVPKYEIRVENVRMPMRDGVKLSTDFYFPQGAGEKLPAILMRTPYDKKTQQDPARMFAGQGYVVAVQDQRGKYESEGRFKVSANDTPDGFDALRWMAAQPWSTGKIGTYGCSNLGEIQVQLAKLRSPDQTAMIPLAAGGAYSYAGLMTSGVMELAMAAGWFRTHGDKEHPVTSPPRIDLDKWWWTLPAIDLLKVAGMPSTDWEGFVSHEPGDPWWDQFGYVDSRHRFDVPALQVCSWYDSVVKETLDLFNLLRTNAESARARDNQFVIISPTTHCKSEAATEHTIVGKRDLGDARFDYWGTYVRWFDHWLKGTDNGVTRMAKVQIYVMGENRWRAANEWPVTGTRFTKYYLHSKGHANSRTGDGRLSPNAPNGAETPDRYRYDPGNPVPSTGGAICCTGSPDMPDGPVDQSKVEERPDILVYTTEPLRDGIEVTGPLELRLFVSSSARDTDFTAKLVDVFPDGTAYNLQEGIIRGRYREGFANKLWMERGKVYPLTIDLQATSNYFAPGHRIRLEVSSSNFPRFIRNLNTGGDIYDETKWVAADNQVHHATGRESYLLLPILPRN